MTGMVRRRRVEVLIDEPLLPALVELAQAAGISRYTLLPALGGAGAFGRWRDDQLSGATGKVMFLAITTRAAADAFAERLEPLLDSHNLMLLSSDVDVVRGPRFG